MSINEQGLISLSGLWELSGKNPDKNPAAWWYSPPAVEMMAQLKREGVSPLWKFTKVSGRWRTLVCIQIATAYAQYLGLLDEAKPKLAQGQLTLAVHGGKAFILKVEESGISPSGGGIAAKPEPTTPALPSKFTIGDKPVATNGDGLVSLTDLHKASGKSVNYRPSIWLRQAEAAEFSAALAEKLNVPVDHIYHSKRGIGGGTFAHWQIALAYAKYLSPELHMAVNEVFMRYKTGDPTLAEEVIREELNVQAVLVHSVTTTNRTTAWGCWL